MRWGGREGGEGPGRGCCEDVWRRSNEEKRKEEIVGVRLTLEVCVVRSMSLFFACLKLREDRNGASSSQNELGRGQSDKRRGVGVREANPEGFAGEQRCSRCMESRVQVRNGRRQPVPRGEVVVDAAVRSTRTVIRWGLRNPYSSKWGLVPGRS